MGRFFTSTQIYNPKQLDRDGFKAYFCEKMKKEGYEVCEADCAELSYVLAFADNCKWVTLSSEAYEQGNRTAQADTARIAKMLGTYCVNTNVIDSDCAMLDLYDDKGKKADTAVMGRADDYLGDDIPAPAKAVWEQFVSPDSTWEKFISVVQGDYVFVEDGLSELAPVIEMDSGNILFEYEDADENSENFCYLSFRKSSSKKEKKLTLNAAFKQVFGEALEPLGFQLVKGRYPYFVRVVNGEIIHIITIAKETSGLRGKKAFNIYGDIATVYRDKIDFSENPEYRIISMTSSYNLLRKAHPVAETRTDEIKELIKKNRDYYYEIDNEESLLEELKVSLKFTKQILLPYIESVSDIDAAFTYLPCGFWEKSDGLLGLKTKRYREILEKKVIEREQQYKRGLDKANYYKISNGYTQEKYEEMLQKHDEFIKKMAEPIEKILRSPELSEKYNKELERRKKANLEMLKSYGIDFEKTQPKKEKKLTLNAAFKQIIGEALEPYGFKIIKGRHPYIVRVINNEILHIITFCNENPEYPKDKAFAIMCGVATIYRKKITFDLSPKENHEWLDYMSSFYTALTHENDREILGQLYKSCYYSDKADSLTSVLTANAESIIKYVLPIMDKIKNIDSCLDYMQEFMMPCNTKKCAKICTFYPDEDEAFLYFLSERWRSEQPEFLNNFLNNAEFQEWVIEEIDKRKKFNTEILKSYGVDLENPQPKKEKKLTLNSAFVKIFGEALEPLGFVKIKSKYPYFVRVVNNEIIHIISYTNTRQKYHNKQPFTIIGGAFSVYRRNFNLDVKPYDNWDSLLDNHKIYCYNICQETYDLNYRKSIHNFTCEIDNNDSIISTMKSSLEVTKNIMLAYLNKLDSIEAYFKELVINNSFELLTESPEELLYYNIDNFEEITRTALNDKADMYKKCVELNRKGYTNENYENIINNLENYVQEIVAPIKANISESASEYIKESEYNKKEIIEKLKSYGITIE